MSKFTNILVILFMFISQIGFGSSNASVEPVEECMRLLKGLSLEHLPKATTEIEMHGDQVRSGLPGFRSTVRSVELTDQRAFDLEELRQFLIYFANIFGDSVSNHRPFLLNEQRQLVELLFNGVSLLLRNKGVSHRAEIRIAPNGNRSHIITILNASNVKALDEVVRGVQQKGGEIGFHIEHYIMGIGASFMPPTAGVGPRNPVERLAYWWRVGAPLPLPRVNVQLLTAVEPESALLSVGLKHEFDHFEDFLKMLRGESSPYYGFVRSYKANLPMQLGVVKELVDNTRNYWQLMYFDENFTMPRNLLHLANGIDDPLAPVNLFKTPEKAAEVIWSLGRTGWGINATTRALVDVLTRKDVVESLSFSKMNGLIWVTARFFVDPKNFRTAAEFKVPLVEAKELSDKNTLRHMYVEQVRSILPILDQTEVLFRWASEYETVFKDPMFAHIDRKTLSRAFIKVVLAPQFGMETGDFHFTREALDEEFIRSLEAHSVLK
jgi:hypothetical protein